MNEEHLDKDPFGEEGESEEVENLITDPMVKKATYLIHKLAEQKKQDFKAIQKKCKKLFAYENLAKVSLEDGHRIIDKLIELTGGEEGESRPGVAQGPTTPAEDGISAAEAAAIQDKEKEREKEKNAPQLPTTLDDGSPKREAPAADTSEAKELESELGKLAKMLQICVHESKVIFQYEFGKENITEGTRATLVKSFAATIFIEAGKRGLGR